MSNSVYKGFYLPTVAGDSGVWGAKLNSSLTNSTFPTIDAALGGITEKSLTNADVTLSAAESTTAILRLTGTISADINIVTSCQGFTFIENSTTGSYTITLDNGAGTPLAVGQGAVTPVIFDETNGPRVGVPSGGSMAAQNANAVAITGGTITDITDIALADGGTGASTASAARTNLGLAIGSNVQAYDSDVAALAANVTNGLWARTGTGTGAARSIVGTSGQVTVTYGNGVSGNPTISLPSTIIGAAFPAGTAMLFAQTAAPTGWTKLTAHNDKALRVVSGTASSGGTKTFSTSFTSRTPTGGANGHALTTAELATHTHAATVTDHGHHHTYTELVNYNPGNAFAGHSDTRYGTESSNTSTATTGITVANANAGSGSAHVHTLSMNAMDFAVQYVDVVICTKD